MASMACLFFPASVPKHGGIQSLNTTPTMAFGALSHDVWVLGPSGGDPLWETGFNVRGIGKGTWIKVDGEPKLSAKVLGSSGAL